MKTAQKSTQQAVAVAEAIQALKTVPSGHLYAAMMGFVSFEEYNAIISTLEHAELITIDRSHLIKWTGDKAAA